MGESVMEKILNGFTMGEAVGGRRALGARPQARGRVLWKTSGL
jgi:hypothetical protein